ncbi:MAG TPA: SxtJ family membrane protein [Longimicrobiales bacterium]|nr:SxtJ family membrane protein [Longimicrobiales bacterium]
MERRIPAGLDAKQGRTFGLTVGVAFLVFASIALWRDRVLTAQVLGGVGAFLLFGAAVFPAKLKPVERAWMFLALQMSKVMTPIVMGIVYFLVLTPIAWAVRSTMGNPLVHRSSANGYWFIRKGEKDAHSDMRRQF